MGSYFPGNIQIGGEIPAGAAQDLCEMVASAGAALDWAGEVFRPTSADELVAAVDPETGHLRLYDDQACFGHFEDLEAWLEEHGIPYDRASDAYFEFDAESVSFRPATGVVVRPATQDGEALVERSPVAAAREVLRAAIVARSPELVHQALEALDGALGPEVSALPRLQILPARQ